MARWQNFKDESNPPLGLIIIIGFVTGILVMLLAIERRDEQITELTNERNALRHELMMFRQNPEGNPQGY